MTEVVQRAAVGAADGGLLERSTHLATLEAALAALHEHGHGCLVLLSGEAGGGKTSLLRRFCEGKRPDRVFWGSCDALFTPRPLGPFLDIARTAGGRLAEAVADAALPHEVAAALADQVTAQGPTVVVLEDLHWADEATFDVLRLLKPRLEQAPALVIITYRDDELHGLHPLRIVLGELRPGRTVRRLEVEPLSYQAVQQLAQPSGLDPLELHRVTGGNPFFVSEVLACPDGAIPRTVRDAVLGRTARLGKDARAVLDAVSATPPSTELRLLQTLVGDDLDGLDECLSAGVLTSMPEGVAFRHELARRAVEQAIPLHRKTDLHRQALKALTGPRLATTDPARLAHHAEGSRDAVAVLRHAPGAAVQAAALGGHREAASQYARALRFAGQAPSELRASLLERLSKECFLTDQNDDAIDALERAVSCRRELGDRLGQAAALCALSRRYWCAGNRRLAMQAAMQALELVEDLPPTAELALAYSNLSQLALSADDAAEAVRLGNLALGLAEKLGATEATVVSLNNLGTVDMSAGRGTARLERSLLLSEQAGLDEHVGRAFLQISWAVTHTRSYELQHWLHRGVESCANRGLELWELYARVFRARFDLDQGRWTDAAETAAAVLRHPRSAPLLRTLALCVTGLVRARRGDPERWVPLDEARSLVAGWDDLSSVAPVALARAEAAWLDGMGSEVVIAETDDVLHAASARDARWVVGEALFWRRCARVEEPAPERLPEPFTLQSQGVTGAATAWWNAVGCPYESALTLAGADDDAALRRALDELQALGARPAAAVVTRRLRERGASNLPRGPRPSTRRNPASLTDREVEVLQLVAEGLRNAEIAHRMFVTEKTVGHHVSAVLRKLEMRTRGEAAVEAARLGLIGERPPI